MQFLHPELLWALFLLLIPIIVHLIQLRRFRKTPFTNVKFLQEVVSEARRNRNLKRWLLLLTRMALLAALVIAFAQPFTAARSALQQKQTVVYLDNSFSMQAKSEGASLLENAVQSLIKSVPPAQRFTLFTNDKVYRDLAMPAAQSELLDIVAVPKQLEMNAILLKGSTFFTEDAGTIKNLVLISDFQQRMGTATPDAVQNIETYMVPLRPDDAVNVSLDTIYRDVQNSGNVELIAEISRTGSIADIPVSLYNGKRLIAKTSAAFKEDGTAKVRFTLPDNEPVQGKVEILDSGLEYDNQLYFNIDEAPPIKVLAVGPNESEFLKRIYGTAEFEFRSTLPRNLNYADLARQNLIVLDGLQAIPTALDNGLRAFTEDGGSLAIIPASDIDYVSYNALISNYFSTSFKQKVEQEREITDINFSHPLYQNVFQKRITNFQYPRVSGFHALSSSLPAALYYQDGAAFLIGDGNAYLFTASLSEESSNFRNSPLIVPTFYNIAKASLKRPNLYSSLANSTNVDIAASLSDDNVLKLVKDDYEFIPRQRSLSNKVSLSFDGDLSEPGIYTVVQEDTPYGMLSFNYERKEGDLRYLDVATLSGNSQESSIAALFESFEKDNRITALWKWFVILALMFLFAEILLQKFMK